MEDNGSSKKEIEKIRLKNICVGCADGLSESQDDNFENYFYKGNNKYQELAENTMKFIISGKKGTGKTILAKYFEREQNIIGNFTITLTERDFVLKKFIEVGKSGLCDEEMDLFIEYTILNQLSKIIIDNKIKLFKLKNILQLYQIRKKIRSIEKIIKERDQEQNYVMDGFSEEYSATQEKEYGGSGKVDLKMVECGGNGNKKVTKKHTVRKEYAKTSYYNVLDKLREDILFISKFISVNLIFDDLDEYNEIITGNLSFINFFNSFIKVANRINSDFRCQKSKSRVIIIMRSDMLVPLNSCSKNNNKIISDSQIKLNWIKKNQNNGMHPLLEMVATKIKNSNDLLKELTLEEVFDRFFPISVNGIKLESYMLNNSFGRPRDIINMLNTIIEEFPESTRFTSKNFGQTKGEYSEKFLGELTNELTTHYPSAQTQECFQILKNINKKKFWISDIERVIEEDKDSFSFFKDAKVFYEFAYKHGIIGNVWPRDNNYNKSEKMKDNYSWNYREDGNENPDPKKRFCLHFALTKSLIHQ